MERFIITQQCIMLLSSKYVDDFKSKIIYLETISACEINLIVI